MVAAVNKEIARTFPRAAVTLRLYLLVLLFPFSAIITEPIPAVALTALIRGYVSARRQVLLLW